MSSNHQPKTPRLTRRLDWLLVLAVILCGQFYAAPEGHAVTVTGQTPTRLAIMNEDSSTTEVEELLTVELSKRTELTLLERQQILRILGEQELSATTRDYLKTGQTIGADGLLVLTPVTENTNKFLQARLIAVRTGILIGETRSPWSSSQPQASIKGIVTHFEQLFEKLTVPAQDAVPISVLNLHSAFRSTDSETLERELTALLIDRLAQQREIFVLERQHLGKVVSEQDFTRTNDSSFWTGQYVINGTVDPEGLSPGQLAIKATLASARDGRPVTISVAGQRDNPAGVIQSLAAEILNVLHLHQRTADWNPLAEADRFSEEAKWAYDWGIYREAQQASESAWALGRHNRTLAVLRIRSYMADHWLNPWNIQRYPQANPRGPWGEVGFSSLRIPNADKLKPANRALELYNEQCRATSAKAQDLEWSDMGLLLLDQAGGLLENFYWVAEARTGNELQLQRLRSNTRALVGNLLLSNPKDRGVGGTTQTDDVINRARVSLSDLRWLDGGYWYDAPEQALQNDRSVIQEGYDPPGLPLVLGWSWSDRKKVPALIRQFVAELSHSTNALVRREGLFLSLAQAPFDAQGNLRAAEDALIQEIWSQRQQVLSCGTHLVLRMENVLEEKYGSLPLDFGEQPFSDFIGRLRSDYLANAKGIDMLAFNELFLQDSKGMVRRFSEPEARQLLPRVIEFRKRLGIPEGTQYSLLELEKHLGDALRLPTTPAPVPELVQQPAVNLATNGPSINGSRIRASFTPWNLPGLTYDPNSRVEVQSSILRSNKLWFHVCWGNLFAWFTDRRSAFVSVNTLDGSTEYIPFPGKLGTVDPTELISSNPYFEVTDDSLFASVQTRLARYRFKDKSWDEIPVPMQRGARLTALAGTLFLTTQEGLLRLKPDGKTIEILGSTRRQSPDNPLDRWGKIGIPYLSPQGRLTVRAAGHTFGWSEQTHSWSEIDESFVEPKNARSLTNQWRVRFSPGVEPKLVRMGASQPPTHDVGVQFERDGHPVDPASPFPERKLPISTADPLVFDLPVGVLVISPSLAGEWLIPRSSIAQLLSGDEKGSRHASQSLSTRAQP